ncbi:MAG TPA: hypothetical protein DCZ95_15530 [Verrucomicrobia bacterium]|nr:MAG: hypothetical protein A2X46_02705 [Lentisphaerae bacterium GWF2_57_35]HBA85497.1 hypothetical protein [Verrucomicrobiota bacterium]
MTFSTRRLIKEGISFAVEGSGLLRRLHRGHVLMLLYHRVLPDEELGRLSFSRSTMVSCSSFEHNLEYLRRAYEPLSMADYLQRLNDGSWDERRSYLVLTFDDGWSDNYHHAWPLLKKYDMPATIFVSTELVGEAQSFWWEEIGEIFQALAPDSTKRAQARKVVESFLGAFGKPGEEAIDDLIERIKSLAYPRIRELIASLSPLVNRSSSPSALTWAQIEEMSGHGLVRFGPHGARHALLPRLSAEASSQEILGSMKALASHAEVRWDPVFSYPGGAYDARTVEQVRQAGCTAALTVDPGVNSFRPPDTFRLRRINVDAQSASSPALFKFRLVRATAEGLL